MATINLCKPAVDALIVELREELPNLRAAEGDTAVSRYNAVNALREIDYLERVVLNGYRAEMDDERYIPVARKVNEVDSKLYLEGIQL